MRCVLCEVCDGKSEVQVIMYWLHEEGKKCNRKTVQRALNSSQVGPRNSSHCAFLLRSNNANPYLDSRTSHSPLRTCGTSSIHLVPLAAVLCYFPQFIYKHWAGQYCMYVQIFKHQFWMQAVGCHNLIVYEIKMKQLT